MPETLVWCTCSICLLNDDGGSWKLKSARVRHRNHDKRNALSPNSDSKMQSSIQKQDSCDFYQETFEHKLYNIEYVSEFDNESRNNDRLESTNKFEDGLGKNNEFERFESIDKSEYELENNIEFGYELGDSDENDDLLREGDSEKNLDNKSIPPLDFVKEDGIKNQGAKPILPLDFVEEGGSQEDLIAFYEREDIRDKKNIAKLKSILAK
ncbi:5180_t:CDS:2 [Racocetra fulgida]|uniref:5180_t:CDS:1 n=1 Tax=Racocetra fulgida TaxID=60492 RepID=A0A9N8ZQU8_9GLOM|nr:5180_t:CDS:2 [Racocetra fulgida]